MLAYLGKASCRSLAYLPGAGYVMNGTLKGTCCHSSTNTGRRQRGTEMSRGGWCIKCYTSKIQLGLMDGALILDTVIPCLWIYPVK